MSNSKKKKKSDFFSLVGIKEDIVIAVGWIIATKVLFYFYKSERVWLSVGSTLFMLVASSLVVVIITNVIIESLWPKAKEKIRQWKKKREFKRE